MVHIYALITITLLVLILFRQDMRADPEVQEPLKPPVTYQPIRMLLQDKKGNVLHEVTLHQETYPSVYSYQGVDFQYKHSMKSGARVYKTR